ncbi:MAG TPA: energy-coupling factor ABC transporter permease [Firmicutes bacterium]|nr:energy-coupling factor ABC transporter permease [Bacillota bacterium]
MTHLHIPDGVIPAFWLVTGFALTGIILALALYKTRGEESGRRLPRLGVVAGVMLLVMSVPLGFLPVHLNLAVLAGIILGPWLAFIATFLVNMFLALVGHGGITALGLNSLILGLEAMLGGWFFRGLARKMPLVPAAAGATAIAMLLSLSLLVGLMTALDIHPLLPGEHRHGVGLEGREESTTVLEHHGYHLPAGRSKVSWQRFLALVLPLGLLGAFLEATAVALVVAFLARVRPDILSPGRAGGRS